MDYRLGGNADLRIINIESPHWANAYQLHKRQAAKIPYSVLERRGRLIADKNLGMRERLFARSFILAVAAYLRWNDLFKTSPSTLVLINACLFGFAPKAKTRGK